MADSGTPKPRTFSEEFRDYPSKEICTDARVDCFPSKVHKRRSSIKQPQEEGPKDCREAHGHNYKSKSESVEVEASSTGQPMLRGNADHHAMIPRVTAIFHLDYDWMLVAYCYRLTARR